MTLALAVIGCGAPPSFPTTPPTPPNLYSLGPNEKPEPPPIPKGVALFEMDAETRSGVIMFAVAGSALFVIVMVLGLAMGPRRMVGAGISAAFLGPAVALAIAARHFARVLTGMAGAPFYFADIALSMWNTNHSLSAHRAAACPTRYRTPLRRSIGFTGLAAVSQAISSRLMLTISAAAVTILVLIVTLILSVTLRPIRRRLLITLFALIVMLSATVLERTWCEVLETTARTGRVPDSFLTR